MKIVRRRSACLALAGIGLTVLAAAGLIKSAADVAVKEQFASEGRPISPAGLLVIDATTRQPAVGALPVAFVRSPDKTGPEGLGRYLIAVNSGYGIQFNSATNKAQQSLAIIDLNAHAAPVVIQNVYFPTPQSVNVGLVFSPRAEQDGTFPLYVSGGFENKIWIFRFRPGASTPITPASRGPNTTVEAPFVDVSGFATSANSPRYNDNRAAVYPAGLAISPDGDTLYVANNLGDSLGIIGNLRNARTITRIDLGRAGAAQSVYPYGVAALPAPGSSGTSKVYISNWADASIAVVDPHKPGNRVESIAVERHPEVDVLVPAAVGITPVQEPGCLLGVDLKRPGWVGTNPPDTLTLREAPCHRRRRVHRIKLRPVLGRHPSR